MLSAASRICLLQKAAQLARRIVHFDRLWSQEVFEAGFVPSDTDYRMFSAAKKQLGRWPDLDIAHILDSSVPHHAGLP